MHHSKHLLECYLRSLKRFLFSHFPPLRFLLSFTASLPASLTTWFGMRLTSILFQDAPNENQNGCSYSASEAKPEHQFRLTKLLNVGVIQSSGLGVVYAVPLGSSVVAALIPSWSVIVIVNPSRIGSKFSVYSKPPRVSSLIPQSEHTLPSVASYVLR